MRVVNGGRRPRLPDEALPEGLVACQRRSQDLERDQAAQALVPRAEHDGHPAPADLLLQPVARDPRARSEADYITHDASPRREQANGADTRQDPGSARMSG